MPPKSNPLGLNALQLKTLTLIQAASRLPDHATPDESDPGAVVMVRLPHPHGDHFHLGDAVVSSRDATGLGNLAVWVALERKGLVRGSPMAELLVITAAGLAYETGLAGQLLHRADH
jgi:hypothetical protein